nr:hypothetical protein [uncultured Chryseobacterium sp.]
MKNSELLCQKWFKLLKIPIHIILVDDRIRKRNKKNVHVLRFQKKQPIELGQSHVTFIIDEHSDQLLSYNNFIMRPRNGSISQSEAISSAINVLQEIDIDYFEKLSYIRTDITERTYKDSEDRVSVENIYWVKFIHENRSYSWVGLAQDGTIEEVEIESYWNFHTMRRKTEMWFHDDWVKALLGQGPQLKSPNAIARLK